MPIEIKNYDGTTLTVIPDNELDPLSSSIQFVGRGYRSWGTIIQQDLLWILQHFAGEAEPANPLAGQIWYDVVNSVLKTYDGNRWITNLGITLNDVAPGAGNNVGSMWFDTSNMQLNVWNGLEWNVIGPLGSINGTDPIDPIIQANRSVMEAIRVQDSAGNLHNIWRLSVGGTILATFSADGTFTPASSAFLSNGFPVISPGITFNNLINFVGVNSVGSSAAELTNLTQTVSKSASVPEDGSVNAQSGTITLADTQLDAGAITSFLFNDTALKLSDHLVITHCSGGTLGAYGITASITANGSATVYVRNNTDAALSEPIVLRFTIIKSLV